MTTWARNVNNQAVDVTTTDPTTIFYPSLAAEFIVVPAGTENGATYNGTVWTNPPPPTPPPAPTTTILSALDFYDCFQPKEAIVIKASADPQVQEFWFRLNQWIIAGKMVDTSTASIQEGVNYLSVTNQIPAVTPAAPYILPSRVPQILLGEMQ